MIMGSLSSNNEHADIETFLDALASADATPGGGAGAALALAMGAALVEMTARLSTGRRRFRAIESDMQRVISRCEAIRTEALAFIDADTQAYERVMDAYALDRGTEQEREHRDTELSRASHQASLVPLRVVARAEEVVDLACETGKKGNQNVVSDAGGGAALARAAIRISEMNVQANLRSITDRAARVELMNALSNAVTVLDSADAVVESILGREGA